MSEVMSRRDRDELAKLARMRAKVARTEADQRAAQMKAEAEALLSEQWALDDEAWADVTAEVHKAIKVANDRIAAKSRERGIPPEAYPSVVLGWSSRGAWVSPQRRAEVRKRVYAAIDAKTKVAKTNIESAALSVQTTLIAGGLDSTEARSFLESMPTVAELLPTVTPETLELLGAKA